jgi:16S rRNA (guanine527-N7)-methyltransferase
VQVVGVSRETLARLEVYVSALAEWNGRFNLVSSRSLGDVWRRHVLDSAQLAQRIPPSARTLVDLGSGAGLPGLVLAALRPNDLCVTLIDATAKKCRFLQAVAAEMQLSVEVRNERIEEAKRSAFDVITARACAPLPVLLSYAQPFAGAGTVCLFLKGQDVGSELTEARNSWRMEVQSHPSLSDPTGTILEIRGLRPT